MAAKARRTTESFAASSEYSPRNAINTGNRAAAEQHALKHAKNYTSGYQSKNVIGWTGEPATVSEIEPGTA